MVMPSQPFGRWFATHCVDEGQTHSCCGAHVVAQGCHRDEVALLVDEVCALDFWVVHNLLHVLDHVLIALGLLGHLGQGNRLVGFC